MVRVAEKVEQAVQEVKMVPAAVKVEPAVAQGAKTAAVLVEKGEPGDKAAREVKTAAAQEVQKVERVVLVEQEVKTGAVQVLGKVERVVLVEQVLVLAEQVVLEERVVLVQVRKHSKPPVAVAQVAVVREQEQARAAQVRRVEPVPLAVRKRVRAAD
jgi:hypothetical protein